LARAQTHARVAATPFEHFETNPKGCLHRGDVSGQARALLVLNREAHSWEAIDTARIADRNPNAPAPDLASHISRLATTPQSGQRTPQRRSLPLRGAQSRYTSRITTIYTSVSRARTNRSSSRGRICPIPATGRSNRHLQASKQDIPCDKDHTDAEGAPDSRCAGMPANATTARLTGTSGPQASSDTLFGSVL
jgi:hypothetical protein